MSYRRLEMVASLSSNGRRICIKKQIPCRKELVASSQMPTAKTQLLIMRDKLNSYHRLFLHPTFIAVGQTNIHPVTKFVGQLNGNSFVDNE